MVDANIPRMAGEEVDADKAMGIFVSDMFSGTFTHEDITWQGANRTLGPLLQQMEVDRQLAEIDPSTLRAIIEAPLKSLR